MANFLATKRVRPLRVRHTALSEQLHPLELTEEVSEPVSTWPSSGLVRPGGAKVTSASSGGSSSGVYTTDFSAAALGAPTGFTPQWVSAGTGWEVIADGSSVSAKTLRHASGDAARRALAWNAVGNVVNAQRLVRVRPSVSDGEVIRLVLRGAGSAGLEHGLYGTLTGAGVFSINGYVGGGPFGFSTSQAFAVTANSAYWVKLMAAGNLMAGKIWTDGGSEPTSWLVTRNDLPAELLSAGLVGVGAVGGAAVRYDSLAAKVL